MPMDQESCNLHFVDGLNKVSVVCPINTAVNPCEKKDKSKV